MTTAPAWSVVVPTYDRPGALAACVRSIRALRPPPGGFELVVVNDGGEEPAASIRDAAETGAASAVRFVSQPNRGPGAARNHGARVARGRRVAFTDDDCRPDPGWLVALDGALDRSPDALVGGPVVNAHAGNLFAQASQALATFTSTYFDGTGRERFFTSNNIALSRAAFLEVGGFDEGFRISGEDREFCDRWHADGRPSALEPGAVVAHAHDLGPASFLRQHVAYGRGARSFRAARRAGGRPVRIDLPFYLASLRHARRSRPGPAGLGVAALTVAAHAAYLAGLAHATLRPGAVPGPPAATPDPE